MFALFVHLLPIRQHLDHHPPLTLTHSHSLPLTPTHQPVTILHTTQPNPLSSSILHATPPLIFQSRFFVSVPWNRWLHNDFTMLSAPVPTWKCNRRCYHRALRRSLFRGDFLRYSNIENRQSKSTPYPLLPLPSR